MSVLRELPDEAIDVVSKQGWDGETLLVLLIGFIREQGPVHWTDRLTTYLRTQADEENRACAAQAED